MTQETGLDYIPEDLPEDSRRKLLELTRESEPEAAPLEVNEYLIRHWCETLEDGNPLYLDEEFARSQGFRGRGPPRGATMPPFAMQSRCPWPPGGPEPARHIHYDVKELLDLPVGIITEI